MTSRKTPVSGVPSSAIVASGDGAMPLALLQAVAYVLRIELRDVEPAIWREVWVPPGITLRKLHAVIQAAMGWENAHLYGFAIPGTGRAGRYWGVPPARRFEPKQAGGGMGFGELANSDATEPLNHVLRAPKDKLLYLYDYGDDWEHVITLRGSTETAEPLPYLAAGQGGCPPEDCGGLQGFMGMIQTWRDSSSPEREELIEWLTDMGIDGEPGVLDATGWAVLQTEVARLRPRKAAVRKPAAKKKVP